MGSGTLQNQLAVSVGLAAGGKVGQGAFHLSFPASNIPVGISEKLLSAATMFVPLKKTASRFVGLGAVPVNTLFSMRASLPPTISRCPPLFENVLPSYRVDKRETNPP